MTEISLSFDAQKIDGPRYVITVAAGVSPNPGPGVGRWVLRLGNRWRLSRTDLGETTSNRAIVQAMVAALRQERAERLPVVVRTCNQSVLQALWWALTRPEVTIEPHYRELVEVAHAQGVPVSFEFLAKRADDPDMRRLSWEASAA